MAGLSRLEHVINYVAAAVALSIAHAIFDPVTGVRVVAMELAGIDMAHGVLINN